MPPQHQPRPPLLWRRLLLAATACILAPVLAALCLASVLAAWSLAAALAAFALLTAGVAGALVTHGKRRLAAVLATLAGCAGLWTAVRPETTTRNPDRPIVARSVSGGAFSPWFAGIAEEDLVAVGARLGLTRTESRDADGMRGELTALAADGDCFDRPDSWVLDGWCCDRGHYWLAAPRGGGPAPLLLFVHGSGGNFRWYACTIGRRAAELGMLAAFPTLGFGEESPQAVADRLAAVLADVQREHAVDGRRIVLIGLSAGARGALAAAERLRDLDPALLVVSGAWLDGARFAAGQRVTFLHGEGDERVPIDEVQRAFAAATAAGAKARLEVVPGGGHLVLLREPERLFACVQELLRR